MTKSELRKCMLSQRKAMSKDMCMTAGKAIVKKISEHALTAGCDRLFVYNSFNNEVNLEELHNLTVPVAVPKVTGKVMIFIDVTHGTVFEKSGFGVMEPKDGNVVGPTANSILLVPGSCFDIQGHRIGYGGGYYDRYLAEHPYKKAYGICYDFQLLEEIPFERHDIKMNGIITEKRVIVL